MQNSTLPSIDAKHRFNTWRDCGRAILAGICIGIGALVNLKVGDIGGAILFAFGLSAVVSMGFNLFTGKAQYASSANMKDLIIMLLFNILTCAIISLTLVRPNPDLRVIANEIILHRLSQPWVAFGGSIGCGFIMTAAVRGVTDKQTYIPLLLGVPTFILCGFPHCIADVVYLTAADDVYVTPTVALLVWLILYPLIIVGNFIGCNLYRLGVDKCKIS